MIARPLSLGRVLSRPNDLCATVFGAHTATLQQCQPSALFPRSYCKCFNAAAVSCATTAAVAPQRSPWPWKCDFGTQRPRAPHLQRRKPFRVCFDARPCRPAGTFVQQPVPPLKQGHVHIHWLDPAQVPDDLLAGPYRALLSPEEQMYVESVDDPGLQRDRVLSRVLVRTTLAQYCNESVSAEGLQFSRGKRGKPAIAGPAEAFTNAALHFNLSNTKGLLGCAVAFDALVGLDTESMARMTRKDPLRLAKRYFSPAEYAAIAGAADEAERQQLFMKLWTLKEAYVKALGRGIRAPPGLSSFTISLGSPETHLPQPASATQPNSLSHEREFSLLCDQASPGKSHLRSISFSSVAETHQEGRWRFCLLEPQPGFAAAVCLQARGSSNADWPASLRMWQTVPLLSQEPKEVDVRAVL